MRETPAPPTHPNGAIKVDEIIAAHQGTWQEACAGYTIARCSCGWRTGPLRRDPRGERALRRHVSGVLLEARLLAAELERAERAHSEGDENAPAGSLRSLLLD